MPAIFGAPISELPSPCVPWHSAQVSKSSRPREDEEAGDDVASVLARAWQPATPNADNNTRGSQLFMIWRTISGLAPSFPIIICEAADVISRGPWKQDIRAYFLKNMDPHFCDTNHTVSSSWTGSAWCTIVKFHGRKNVIATRYFGWNRSCWNCSFGPALQECAGQRGAAKNARKFQSAGRRV
jgi:hypothetical protein